MTPSQIEQVFGRERLKMTTGDHVEVFREAMAPGERRRYTKRFLATRDGDFGPWTEREWRILARLIGHGIRCVPDVVQFDGGALGGVRLVQTYDAGVTVDQWGTLLPVARDGDVRRHVFEDCAHWWALSYHCLAALDEIHALGLVHLDIKGDNICIPCDPADFDPDASGAMLHPAFARLALIDFAFSLVSRESLAMALPIGWQKDYDYQSPRLLRALDAGRNGELEPTRELDWRCDLYSLAAMLRRYLPDGGVHRYDRATSWTPKRYDDARTLILRLRDSHDRDLPHWRPHGEFMEYAAARMEDAELKASLAAGWTFARDASATEEVATPMTPITPMTRVAPAVVRTRATQVLPMVGCSAPLAPPAVERPVPVIVATVAARLGAAARIDAAQSCARTTVTAVVPDVPPIALLATRRERRFGVRHAALLTAAAASIAGVATPLFVGDAWYPGTTLLREFAATLRESLPFAATNQADPAPMPENARAEGPAAQPDTPAPGPATTQASPTDSEPESQNADDTLGALPAGDAPPAPSTPTSATASASAEEAAPATAAAIGTSPSDAALKEPRVPSQDVAQAAPSSNARTRGAVAAGAASARARTATSRPPAAKRSPLAAAKASISTARNSADAKRHAGAQPSSAERARAQAATTRLALAAMSQPPKAQPSNGTTGYAPASGIGTSNIATSSAPPAGKISGARNTVTTSPSSTPALVVAAAGSAMASGDHRDESLDDARAAPAAGLAANAVDAAEPAGVQSEMPVPQHSAPRERSRNDWRAKLSGFFGLFHERRGPAAPVEERSARSMAARTQVEPRSVGPAPATAPTALVPLGIEPVVATPPAKAPAEALASSTMAPELPPSAAAAAIAPASQNLRRIPAPPAAVPTRTGATRDQPLDLVLHAQHLLVYSVPRVAALAEPELARVLSTAAVAQHPAQARLVVDVADAPWPSESVFIPAADTTSAYARRLHNEARRALATGRDVADAVNLELEAFGANPRDPDIAGYLAFLHLRMKPARPETARQLALHALILSGSRRSARQEEWMVLAVASALTGRESDAVRVLLAQIALSDDTDRVCQSARRAYASYGERMRAPMFAMLQRIHAQGRGFDYPSCAWPPYLSAGIRAPGAY